ncbi:hypothetical protein [Nonomuraea angiospora]
MREQMDEKELRQAAVSVRAELAELIADEAERAVVDAALAEALAAPEGSARPALSTALRSHPATRAWMRAHTRVAYDVEKSVGLLGEIGEVGVLFVCPNRDHSEVREAVTGELLLCPHDGAVLERIDG